MLHINLLYRNLENSYTMVMKFFIIVKKTTRYSGEGEMKMVFAHREGLLYSGGFQGVSPLNILMIHLYFRKNLPFTFSRDKELGWTGLLVKLII